MIKVKLLKENKTLHPLDDFLIEISWWQKRGIGTTLSKKHLTKHFNEGIVKELHHSELEEVANCYNKLIKGDTQEERFESLFENYLRDRRGPKEQRGRNDEEKREYLNKLMESVINKTCPPPVVVEINKLGKFMTGGRTRAALAKVADVPINIRHITLPEESLIANEVGLDALTQTMIKEGKKGE